MFQTNMEDDLKTPSEEATYGEMLQHDNKKKKRYLRHGIDGQVPTGACAIVFNTTHGNKDGVKRMKRSE